MSSRSFGFGFEVSVPAQFDTTKVTHGWEPWLRNIASRARAKLEQTVEGWENPPTFQVRGPYRSGNDLVCDIFTDDERWYWANVGTAPHTITGGVMQSWAPVGAAKQRIVRGPSKDGLLHFKPMQIAKTTPRQFSSRPQIVRAEGWRTAKSVRHPGSKPREWTEVLREEIASEMAGAAVSKMRRGVDQMESHPASPSQNACFRPGHGC